jgi:hypothetical protein
MLRRSNKYRNKGAGEHHPSPLDRGFGFTIRFAHPDDEVALRRLAACDSQLPLSGRVLLAEVSGEIWAAISVDGDGRTIADPFRHTASLVSLLKDHAAGVPASRTHIPVRGAGRPAALAAG